RFGLTRKVARSPGQALSDFNIFKLIAHYWRCAEMFREWTSPEAVFQILKRLSARRPCDFSGIRDYQHLDECGGIQWPWPLERGVAEPGTVTKTKPLSPALSPLIPRGEREDIGQISSQEPGCVV